MGRLDLWMGYWDRFKRWAGSPAGDSPRLSGAFYLAIALGIGAASVGGALGAWRASVAAAEASELQRRGLQELLQQKQILAAHDAATAQDRRTLIDYQESVFDLNYLGELDPLANLGSQQSRTLERDRRVRRIESRVTEQFFRVFLPAVADNGYAYYRTGIARRAVEARSEELLELTPEYTLRLAGRERGSASRMQTASSVFVLALFFLTLAEFSRKFQRVLGCVGAVALVAGTISMTVLEIGRPGA